MFGYHGAMTFRVPINDSRTRADFASSNSSCCIRRTYSMLSLFRAITAPSSPASDISCTCLHFCVRFSDVGLYWLSPEFIVLPRKLI